MKTQNVFICFLYFCAIFIFLFTSFVNSQPTDSEDELIWQNLSTNDPVFKEVEMYMNYLNPNNIIIGANTEESPNDRGVVTFISTNFGNTWTLQPSQYYITNSKADPAVYINYYGNYFCGFIADNQDHNVAYSTNGGVNWTNVFVASSADRNHMAINVIDRTGAFDEIYTGFNTLSNVVKIFKSTNHGINWTDLNYPNTSYDGTGIHLTVDPTGYLHAVWAELDSPANNVVSIKYSMSVDGGSTWSDDEITVKNISNLTHKKYGVPYVVYDDEVNIYVSWIENIIGGESETPPNYDIFIAKKIVELGNNHFSSPIRMTSTSTGDQFMPSIAADFETGNLVCIYYDTRDNGSYTNTYVSYSTNGGNNWSDLKVSDEDMLLTDLLNVIPGVDYISVRINDNHVIPVWSDNRSVPTYGSKYRLWTSPFDLVFGGDGDNLLTNTDLQEKSFNVHPNPFNPESKISFTLKERSEVTLNIMDVSGKIVKQLANSSLDAGNYDFNFKAEQMASGIYFAVLKINNKTYNRKMVLLK